MKPRNESYNVHPAAALLIAAAFWAPIAGGYVSTESLGLSSADNPILLALTGDAAIPYLSHALVSLPIAIALIWILVERKIQQIPTNRVSLPLGVLLGVILGTAPLSQASSVTIPAAAEWLIYGMATMATVMVAGRKQGPVGILTAIFIGCVVVSLVGLREYGTKRGDDPTWRIFGNWIGPNALAGMLLVGLIVGLSRVMTRERAQSILAGLGTAMIAFALALTQSKGAMVALAVGLVCFLFAVLLWGKKETLRTFPRLLAVAALIVALTFGLQASQRNTGSGGADRTTSAPLARFSDVQGSQEQSFGFRKLLWQGSVKLMQENPAGYGAGTYRFWSARPGLTTITQFSHNSYLQLGVESSPVAALALAIMLLMWTIGIFRSPTGVPIDQRILKAGVFGAVAAVAAHSVVDSDLHYFGIGLTFFILIGLGLLLSTDAVAPEFTPKPIRYTGAVVAGCVAFALLWSGWLEAGRAQVRGLIQERKLEEAAAKLQSLRTVAPSDGEVWYLSGVLAPTAHERERSLAQAVALQPWTRNLRALARAQATNEHHDAAVDSYEKALRYDPNNMPALLALMRLHIELGNESAAQNAAERLLKVEETQYFKTRSQPDIVPTETAAARRHLAATAEPGRKIELLVGALRIYKEYAARTIPQIQRFSLAGMDLAGQTPREGLENLESALATAKDLTAAYRARGLREEASTAAADAAAFEDLISELR